LPGGSRGLGDVYKRQRYARSIKNKQQLSESEYGIL
jgi:hypothetical protein